MMSNNNLYLENNVAILNNNQHGFISKRNVNEILNNDPFETGKFQNMGNNCLYLNEPSNIEDYYKNMIILITSGQAINDIRTIIKYNRFEKSIIVDNDFSKIIQRGDTYEIYSEIYVGIFFDENSNEFKTVSVNDIDINRSKKVHVNIHSNNGIFDSNVSAKSYLTSSDARLKDNINYINYNEANDIIKNINGVNFEWNNDNNNDKQIGFIAQEVEKIAPDMVHTNNNGYKSVEYNKFIPLLVETIKGLTERVNDLERKNM